MDKQIIVARHTAGWYDVLTGKGFINLGITLATIKKIGFMPRNAQWELKYTKHLVASSVKQTFTMFFLSLKKAVAFISDKLNDSDLTSIDGKQLLNFQTDEMMQQRKANGIFSGKPQPFSYDQQWLDKRIQSEIQKTRYEQVQMVDDGLVPAVDTVPHWNTSKKHVSGAENAYADAYRLQRMLEKYIRHGWDTSPILRQSRAFCSSTWNNACFSLFWGNVYKERGLDERVFLEPVRETRD